MYPHHPPLGLEPRQFHPTHATTRAVWYNTSGEPYTKCAAKRCRISNGKLTLFLLPTLEKAKTRTTMAMTITIARKKLKDKDDFPQSIKS